MTARKNAKAKIPDTRGLFWTEVERKAVEWRDSPRVANDDLSEAQKAALVALYLAQGGAIKLEIEHPYDSVALFAQNNEMGRYEYILSVGGQVFYVNTEGYDYARYSFRIVEYRDLFSR